MSERVTYHYSNVRAVIAADLENGLYDRVYLIPDSMTVGEAITKLEESMRHVKVTLGASEDGYSYDDLDRLVAHYGLRPVNTMARTSELF